MKSHVLAAAVALACAGAFAGAAANAQPAADGAAAPTEQKNFSAAERLLFMGDPLSRMKPPSTLRYSFHKGGTLESGFDDAVAVNLTVEPDGKCCAVTSEFLSGERRIALPPIEHADANPVLLYFLERDVREMKRITKGSENYYRKRIRMAVYDAATVKDLSFRYAGHTVSGHQVSLQPYDEDPARSRFEKYARKRYEFFLSDDVPGGVYGIRTVMLDASDAAGPLLVEEMFLDGAEPTTGRTSR